MVFPWSHGRTENRFATSRLPLFLADAPLFRKKMRRYTQATHSRQQKCRNSGPFFDPVS
jgi:hypothetical protein